MRCVGKSGQSLHLFFFLNLFRDRYLSRAGLRFAGAGTSFWPSTLERTHTCPPKMLNAPDRIIEYLTWNNRRPTERISGSPPLHGGRCLGWWQIFQARRTGQLVCVPCNGHLAVWTLSFFPRYSQAEVNVWHPGKSTILRDFGNISFFIAIHLVV